MKHNRIIAFVLVLMMLAACMPVFVSAEDTYAFTEK